MTEELRSCRAKNTLLQANVQSMDLTAFRNFLEMNAYRMGLRALFV